IMDDEAEAFTLDIDFVASRIWLTKDNEDTSYSFAQSTVVVREMIFADDLRYNPSESVWGFNEESEETAFLPLFNHTILLSPSDDLLTIGGRNCESSPATDCLRTNKTFNPTASELVYISQNHDKWEEESSLNTKRAFHTSTLLPDSSILTCGGSDGTQPLSSCELLNPISQEWDFVYPMNYTRSNHTATLLANGTVLIVGGKLNSSTAAINTAEIYYPDTYKFVETSPMASPRANHTATLLPDGNVLITAGGTMSSYSNTSEIYITTEAAWQTVSDNLTTGRSQHTATLLKNGNVMIIGGIKSGALDSCEIFNPTTRQWTSIGGDDLNMKRYDHTANLLKNGRVLVSGGSNGLEILKTAEIYNGVSWTYTLNFPTAEAGTDMTLRREN
ncbi:MAG: hypothetical protein KAJ48_10190, partial [Elusimicrobiales bacterium]|nr:hypothetical protein [Elusimicrobiales bacterium]